MATKELAFSAKIKNLGDYLRQIISFTHPPPPGTDVANTIKYFITTLLNILKDAPNIEGEKFYGAKYARSNMRLAMFPTLNYSGLYDVMNKMLPVVHLVTIGQEALMEALLQLIACITPFLMWDQLTQLPYSVAMLIPMSHPEQYAEIVRIMCVNLLPNTLGPDVGDNMMTTESIAGMLMLILQHCKDPKLHTMFIESLLPLRDCLYKDLFTVISYGPPNTKIPAVKLLFHYWPQLVALLPSHGSSYTESYKVAPWSVPICQRVHCINKIAKPSASKMCTHPNMCAAECQMPPPAFICVDCYDTHGMRMYDDSLRDIVLPSDHITIVCSNKTCPLPGSKAVAVCTSLNCVKMNRNRPVSLCEVCHNQVHPGIHCGHVQESISNLWQLEPETQSYVVDSIVSLLREAEPDMHTAAESALQPIMDDSMVDFQVLRDPVNSRYGVLLLKELCKPQPGLCVNALGRLLGMLFHWFQCTGSTQNPVATEILEKLKTETMTEWLQEVKKSHYEVILSTLLPHPPDFAKVGGQWERLSSRTDQLKEGLEKLIMLGPYNIVTYEVWDYIMPYWLESIRTELTLKEREEIKTLLRQTFDIEMSPLPFLLDKMYHFIYERFESLDQQIQEQGLQWLQILTSVDIAIPFLLLLNMFREGTGCLLKPTVAEPNIGIGPRQSLEVKLNCFILMLDILLKQSELNHVTPHSGVTLNKSKEMFILLNDMFTCISPIKHVVKCETGSVDCDTCRRLTVFYQLSFNLLRVICPQQEASLPVLDIKQLADQNSATPNILEETESAPVPVMHTLFVTLLQIIETDRDKDIHYYVASSLKALFVHGQCLNLVYKTHAQMINQFLQQQFIPRLWKMLDSRKSRTSKISVIMLFHAIALGEGHKYFWSIVNGDCMHKNWQVRYAAVDKIRMIWENSSTNVLSKNQVVLTALAHVFCQYVTLLHDSDHNVAQRAMLQLDLVGEVALQAIMKCMSMQFDVVAKDRQLILYKLSQLQNAMPERQVLSWSFYLSRLQQLYVEAELGENSESGSNRGSMVQVRNDMNKDQMIKIARFAAMRSDSISSIRDQSGVHEKSSVSMTSQLSNLSNRRFGGGHQILKPKSKKKPASHSDSSIQDDVMPEVGNEGGKIIKTLWKAMESDKLDQSVLHLLVSSIMKYLAKSTCNEGPPVNSSAEHQVTKQISTIEHVFYLLGYAEEKFYVQPSQLRTSPILDALLLNLAQFLDGNVEMGTKILLDCLNVLRFCGSPQKYASDNQAADYTLVHLPQPLTKYWVQALLIILYKYNYSNNPELSPNINYLVRIILNTLSAIPHSCKPTQKDTDSIHEVQGVIQGNSDQDSQSGVPEGDEGGQTPGSIPLESWRSNFTSATLPSSTVVSAVIHEEDECLPQSNSRRSTMDKDLVTPIVQPVSSRTKHTQPVPAAAMNMGDFADMLSNPQGSKPANQPSTQEKADFADLLSDPKGAEAKFVSSNSSPALKKSYTQGDTKTKKPKRIQRQEEKTSPTIMMRRPGANLQVGVDISSPSKSTASGEKKLKHWNTIDSIKSEDMAALVNPQGKAAALTPPADGHVSGGASKSATLPAKVNTEGSTESRKSDTSAKKFGLRMHSRRQNSKTNMWENSGSSADDEQTAIIQSFAAAATDFMARSKRGQPLNVGKQDSNESGDHKRNGNGPQQGPLGLSRRLTCPDCSMPIEDYSEDVIVLCIVSAETYLNHDLNQAAGMVYEMILSVSNIAHTQIYSWQNPDRPVFIPGNVTSAALQFLRCTLHHLNPYKIMSALLLSSENSKMFKTIVTALTDFHELTVLQALLTGLEGVNEKHSIRKVVQLIENLNSYLSAITTDQVTSSQDWPKIVDQLDTFFRKLTGHLPKNPTDLSVLLTLMSSVMKLPVVTTHKGDRLVETFGKLISSALQEHTFNMIQLAKLCQLCYKIFSKDRDKTILARMIVNELIQVLKYKSTLPEANVLILLEIVCMDCSSTLLPTYITNEIPTHLTCDMMIETGILDVMRLYLSDAVEFVSDLHTLLKLKAHTKPTCLHEDTFGGLLKTGVAQIIALEMSAMIQSDPKATQRVIPWLYNQPNTIQRGPKEFLESVDHVRFLCWLYIGALTHHAVAENVLHTKCQPLPFDDVNNISVMVMSIMTGFVEYSASSVEFMSSLFYAFILCQVWTVYCETLTAEGMDRDSEDRIDVTQIIYDFWAKVTPTILNLMSHSRVLTEMVNLHVLSMMETLQECQSSVVLKLFPLWRQLLYSNQNKLPINILVRLQTLENWQPQDKKKYNKAILFEWIKKVQFKLAQIEVQSSTAVKLLAI